MDGWIVRGRREEAVVDKGAFEDDVGEEIEEVPDEKDADTRGGAGVQGDGGEEVRGEEENENEDEGEDGCFVNYGDGGGHGY